MVTGRSDMADCFSSSSLERPQNLIINNFNKLKTNIMTTKKQKEETIEIQRIEIDVVKFRIRGVTPLIVNRFSEKAKQMILDKQMKKATKGKEAKDPVEQYNASLYKFHDGKRTGFPAVGFKAAMVRAAKNLGLIMIDERGKFHIMADEGELVEIKNAVPHMREDMVRVGMGTADVRFRGEYDAGWEAELTIQYFKNAISKEQLAQLLTLAGFSCGIGEWRPEKCNTGSYGIFQII
jgi:hypothetical protein